VLGLLDGFAGRCAASLPNREREALVGALEQGCQGFAVLDEFDVEPLVRLVAETASTA